MGGTDELIKALKMYYKCTGCYTSLFNYDTSEMIMSCEERFSEIFQDLYKRLASYFSAEPGFVFVNGFEMYSGFVTEENGGRYTVVLGPAFTADPFKDRRLYGKTLYMAANGDTEKVRDFLYCTSIVSKSRFKDNTCLCCYLVTGKIPEDIDIGVHEEDRFAKTGKSIDESLFEQREEGIDNFYPVARQNMVLDCVKRGNVHGVKKIISESEYKRHNTFRWSRDFLLNYRLIYMSAMVLVHRAAVEAGMVEAVAAMIFKSFCQELDECCTYQQIRGLFNRITVEYTERIADMNLNKSQSISVRPAVKMAMDYINAHLHENIAVTDISKYCSVSESNLRKKFKEDVGESVVFYIAKQKVEEAKTLLRYSDYSIIEISEYLSFSSQSYFTNVFKKVCGTTPAEYRNNCGKNR